MQRVWGLEEKCTENLEVNAENKKYTRGLEKEGEVNYFIEMSKK